MTSIKKVFTFIFFGFFLIFSLDLAITFLVKKSNNSHTGKINAICSHNDVPQIAFFGSSCGEKGINAKLISDSTKKTSFNYSLDGTTFMQYEGLVDEILNNEKKPEKIILTETYFSLSKKEELTSIERYAANIYNTNVYNSLYNVQPSLAWKCKFIPFYKYITFSHTYYLNAFNGFKNLIGTSKQDSDLGQLKVNRTWETNEDVVEKISKQIKIELDTNALNHYDELLSRIKNKTQVKVVLMPFYAEIGNKVYDITPTRNAFETICKKNGVEFLDYTQNSLCFDKSFFYNVNHLNSKGADYFTSLLLKTF